MNLTVLVGDMKIGRSGDMLVTHALGSCLGLMAFDPVARLGGLLHAMLPLSKLLGPLSLVLLFGLLTGETGSFFSHASRAAAQAGDAEGALRASRQGGLAVSVLWTVFATFLLAGGLGLPSLPLFYAAYALFAITRGKVVLVDLATLPTLYRMLSFLALGVVLLAGAWLNLRFRERLSAPGGDPR